MTTGCAARRLSCDQDIAADGFFSLAMIAEFEASLSEHGPSFYRHLFWESGVIGQVLYLEAEAARARATGIGCFYDDPVHELLGLNGRAFQSLYHFTVGIPVEDGRLATEPAYAWESSASESLPSVDGYSTCSNDSRTVGASDKNSAQRNCHRWGETAVVVFAWKNVRLRGIR